MKKYRISISYSEKHKHYIIQLQIFKKIGIFKNWATKLTRTGTPRDIDHYKSAWQNEFGVAPEDIKDTREAA